MLLNDSIGTFAGGRYLDPDIMIGIILGTGTNMAYLERKAVIHNAPHKLPAGYSDEMLINSEWGCYDSPLLPVCPPMCRTRGPLPGSCQVITRPGHVYGLC